MQKFLLASAVALPLMVGQTVLAQSGTSGQGAGAAGAAPGASSTQPRSPGNTQASPGSQGASPGAPGASQSSSPAAGGSPSGATGSTGPTGSTGTTGDMGNSGATGAMGAAAPAGAIGGVSVKDGLLGETVYNSQDEKVGEVSDIVLAQDGRTAYYIIGAGGFLGMGEHDVAIESSKVSRSGDKLLLQGYTKDQLKEMPQYQAADK